MDRATELQIQHDAIGEEPTTHDPHPFTEPTDPDNDDTTDTATVHLDPDDDSAPF